MVPITRHLLTHPLTRPALRQKDGSTYFIREVKGIVVHWTANTKHGANAEANRSYFNQGFRPASAHYIVDSNGIVQCIPDNEVAFHCGDKPLGHYKPIGAAFIKGTRLTPNYFTIGVELCVNADGNWPATYQSGVELCARLLIKHGLNETNLHRHYDITGKRCPAMFIEEKPWQTFRDLVGSMIRYLQSEYLAENGRVNTKNLNVRTGPGTSFPIRYELFHGENITVYERLGIGWVNIGGDEWVNEKFLKF